MIGKGELKIFKIFGIEIAVDFSWFWIFLLVTWSFAAAFGSLISEPTILKSAGLGIVASLFFFASVIAHEISHTLVARKNGLPVRKITLFLFGGVSNLTKEPPTPWIEFQMAVAGPLASLVIGGLLLLLAFGLRTGEDSVFILIIEGIGLINILLAIFNLLPGFPLDGGRILRAMIWKRIGNLVRATRYASLSGQAIAVMIIILGGFQLFFFGLLGGIWLILIGFFLYQTAKASFYETLLSEKLNKLNLRNLAKFPPVIQAEESLETLREQIISRGVNYLAVKEQGEITGVIVLKSLAQISPAQWPAEKVRKIMIPLEDLPKIEVNADPGDLLGKFAENRAEVLSVWEKDKLIGFITLGDIQHIARVAALEEDGHKDS